MDCLVAFLSSLHEKGVSLWRDGDRLRYRAEEGALTDNEIDTLRLWKDEIIEALAEGPCADERIPVNVCRPTSCASPLTFQQQSLLDYIRIAPEWNCLDTFALRLCGALNAELLRKAIEEVIRRHGALRTRIIMNSGVPAQWVDDPCEFQLEVVDVAGASRNEIDVAVRRVATLVTNQGCDLAAGPLFNARLLKLDAREHLLVWSIHHIVSDGSANSLLFRELWLLYAESLEGRPSPLRHAPLQYATYAVWQRKTYHSWFQKHGSYWDGHLAGTACIQWPRDGRRTERCDTTEWAEISIGQPLSDGLRELARRERTLLGMVMLTVYVLAVARLCNQNSLVVATTVNGRDHPELEGMIGYCAHGLYLRVQWTGEQTFVELLRQVNRNFVESLSQKDFGRVIAQYPELSARATFQWMPWQPGEIDGMPMSDLSHVLDIDVEPFRLARERRRTSPFDIMTVFGELFSDAKRGICGGVLYRSSEFSADTIGRFQQDLQFTAENVVQNPSAQLRLGRVLGTARHASSK